MIYLSHIDFPDNEAEMGFRWRIQETCYSTAYPFFILSKHCLEMIDFDTITVLYGSNGSGKSTALNVIAERLRAKRDALFNKTNFYRQYLKMCKLAFNSAATPAEIRIITSDDVFEFMLNLRAINQGIDVKREELFSDYFAARDTRGFRMRSLDDYEKLKEINEARSNTKSQFVKNRLGANIREQSNGESAQMYFTEKIQDGGLYLLDEPENSLSPERQLELKAFIEEAAQERDCQIIMATHSPFLLSVRGAKIYDLDADPVDVKKWTELPNIRTYKEFFDQHADEFR